jgi:hypothetical protein
MNTTLRALSAAFLIVGLFGVAVAKLPAPPPQTDEQKAAAAAKKSAADHAAAEAYKHAEDRVVARYIAEQKAKGITVTPQAVTAPAPAAASSTPAKK